MDSDDIPQFKFNFQRKIMVIGAPGAGKSAFVLQFSRYRFIENQDPALEYVIKGRANVDGMQMVFDLLDTADHAPDTTLTEQPNVRAAFLKDKVHMIVVVYDITKRATFERVTDYWYKAKAEIDKIKSSIKPLVLLIGNKLDLQEQRAVKTEEGKQLARELGMMFGELSSKTRENMDELMDRAVKEIALENPRAYAFKPVIKVTPSHQADHMSSLLKSPIFSDAVLTLDEHKWNVHKFILSARSPVLMEQFRDPSINEVAIKCANVSAEAVTALIHFMYTGLVDFAPKLASQVETLSAEYKVEMLGEIAGAIAKKGSYEPTSESLTARANKLNNDFTRFLKQNIPEPHPALDAALKIGNAKPILASRALLALNSKYFLDLFEKHQEKEVQIDRPNLDSWKLTRVVDWCCGVEIHSGGIEADLELIQIAAELNLPKSLIETIENNTTMWILNFEMKPNQWLAVLNQSVGEQIKKLAEWHAAVQYAEFVQKTDVWKKINSASRKEIQNLARNMGSLVEDKNAKNCVVM